MSTGKEQTIIIGIYLFSAALNISKVCHWRKYYICPLGVNFLQHSCWYRAMAASRHLIVCISLRRLSSASFGKFVPGPNHTNVCKISRLWEAICSRLFHKSLSKLGNVTHFKAFFLVVSTADILNFLNVSISKVDKKKITRNSLSWIKRCTLLGRTSLLV